MENSSDCYVLNLDHDTCAILPLSLYTQCIFKAILWLDFAQTFILILLDYKLFILNQL